MTDKDEYVIINRTAIEKRIEWFENKKRILKWMILMNLILLMPK